MSPNRKLESRLPATGPTLGHVVRPLTGWLRESSATSCKRLFAPRWSQKRTFLSGIAQHISVAFAELNIMLIATCCPGEKHTFHGNWRSISLFVIRSWIANSPFAILVAPEPMSRKYNWRTNFRALAEMMNSKWNGVCWPSASIKLTGCWRSIWPGTRVIIFWRLSIIWKVWTFIWLACY